VKQYLIYSLLEQLMPTPFPVGVDDTFRRLNAKWFYLFLWSITHTRPSLPFTLWLS